MDESDDESVPSEQLRQLEGLRGWDADVSNRERDGPAPPEANGTTKTQDVEAESGETIAEEPEEVEGDDASKRVRVEEPEEVEVDVRSSEPPKSTSFCLTADQLVAKEFDARVRAEEPEEVKANASKRARDAPPPPPSPPILMTQLPEDDPMARFPVSGVAGNGQSEELLSADGGEERDGGGSPGTMPDGDQIQSNGAAALEDLAMKRLRKFRKVVRQLYVLIKLRHKEEDLGYKVEREAMLHRCWGSPAAIDASEDGN